MSSIAASSPSVHRPNDSPRSEFRSTILPAPVPRIVAQSGNPSQVHPRSIPGASLGSEITAPAVGRARSRSRPRSAAGSPPPAGGRAATGRGATTSCSPAARGRPAASQAASAASSRAGRHRPVPDRTRAHRRPGASGARRLHRAGHGQPGSRTHQRRCHVPGADREHRRGRPGPGPGRVVVAGLHVVVEQQPDRARVVQGQPQPESVPHVLGSRAPPRPAAPAPARPAPPRPPRAPARARRPPPPASRSRGRPAARSPRRRPTPRSRMNAQPRTDSLRSNPSGPRSSATESWLPRSASGSNNRPPGASWATHSGRTSELPTVSTMRSYGAPGG